MEEDKGLQVILKKYLSHIVYIDDEFKIAWDTQEKSERPSRSRRNIVTSGQEESLTEKEMLTSDNDNLENFCLYVQERYPELLMTPLLYRDSVNDEKLSEHMRTARLLILDWKLTEQKTAISLLKMVKFANQLRFCVIYTSKFEEAREEFVKEILSGEDDKLKENEEKSYLFARVDSVIYMLCEKDKFDPNRIIESLVEVFTNEIGFFPIAFIDMIVRLEEKVPYYLDKFSQPFDKLIFLQTSADGLPLKDVSDSINNMVINNIRSDIELNDEVLKNIYSRQVQNIKDLLDSDEFDERLRKKLTSMLDRLKCEEREKEILLKNTEEYKDVIRKVVDKPDDLNKGINNAVKKMKQIYGRRLAEKVLSENSVDINKSQTLLKELKKVYESQYENKIKEILPAFLMILTDADQNYKINNLITAVKIVKYDENRRWFSQVFKDSHEIDEKEEWACLKKINGNNGDPDRSLLQNKLHPGDVFFNRNETSDMEETCYLCIVPSCHLLRPKKVDGVILFIHGRIISTGGRPGQIRDSEHFTVLPGIEEGKQPISVLWKYHRIKELDLNKMSKKDFDTLYRPYRLTYEYTRQIIGEFVAFYSKSGVDELFLNSEIPLDRLFENIPEGNADGQID